MELSNRMWPHTTLMLHSLRCERQEASDLQRAFRTSHVAEARKGQLALICNEKTCGSCLALVASAESALRIACPLQVVLHSAAGLLVYFAPHESLHVLWQVRLCPADGCARTSVVKHAAWPSTFRQAWPQLTAFLYWPNTFMLTV